MRFYYNPKTTLLEPIAFDAIEWKKYDYVIQNYIMGKDSIFTPFHNKYLKTVATDTFLTSFLRKHETEMNMIL